MLRPFETSLEDIIQVWTSLDKFGQVWTSIYKYITFFLFFYSLFFGLRLSSLGVSGVLGFFGGSGVDNLILNKIKQD